MSDSLWAAIIVAGGQGHRFGGRIPKQLQLLSGRPVLHWTVRAFDSHPLIGEIAAVVPAGQEAYYRDLLNLPERIKVTAGGAERSQSAAAGLAAVSREAEVCLIHDGVRPLVSREEITRAGEAARIYGAAVTAVPVRDTLKEVSEDLFILRTADRSRLWQAQTPQAFRREVLEEVLAGGLEISGLTDEAQLLERLGRPVKIVPGSPRNLKITYPEDLLAAEAFFAKAPRIRLGQGWDFHRFDPNRPLYLGCLLISGHPGLSGHSDADVLAHALADGFLGAAGLGDIGLHFPPGDPAWAGASGTTILDLTSRKTAAAGWELVNADLTLIGETPKIWPYRKIMTMALAAAVRAKPEQLNLKATTTEGMGFAGRGEGLAAAALVCLARADWSGQLPEAGGGFSGV
ncbi:MAG: 2-C-methyl-D-erythritol 4-phosphate cytidylyltransferase [Deltaproteobacteria bacterium]|jgi:2-C-methyl-D-erythritol 4-phosphate cytidylyltransferase/2-C-methyl-D-erythritol 2,4-cyclodiphosphate synthase|nr:2-C-methyl-D-erythritol 4-phosphate cytidylyltransferase [Deltaproteobacteria bacterium]